MELLQEQKKRQLAQHEVAGSLWQNKWGLCFTNEVGRYHIPQTLVRNYKKIVAAIGRPELRFHDLRHSYAVASIESGDDIKTLQGNLGHATAAFTLDIYAHMTSHMSRASANRMQAYIDAVRNG